MLLFRTQPFIISTDVIFFKSKSYFNIESHSSKSNEDYLHFFLLQECFVDNIASLEIMI